MKKSGSGGHQANHHKKGNRNLPYFDTGLSIEERTEDLLGRMSVPEKIGQMTQLDITLINRTGKQDNIELSPEKARKLLLKHHIGSFLNGEAAPPHVWHKFMSGLCRIASEETRLGIPLIFGIDHIHGASYVEGATIFPHALNLGATFNPEHALQAGRITRIESAPLGHHWIFSPVLDLGLNPLWARFYETYGEDPHLASQMGKAYVEGIQNCPEMRHHPQAATAKHFLGYSDPRSGWDRTPAHIPMQQIHEFHRPSFQKAIDAGLKAVMLNSGELNGVPVHGSHQITTGLLREQMGFDGVVVTDWDDVGKLVDFHYTAADFKEATYDSVMAGIDVCMTPLHLKFNTCMTELVDEGRITEERLNESVRRILKMKFELGLFEQPVPDKDAITLKKDTKANRDKALQAARESIVLLKNNSGLLPLKNPKKIGIAGPSANSKRNLAGGWTIAWQGAKEEQYPEHMDTIHSALAKAFPESEVVYFTSEDIHDTGSSALSRMLNSCNVLIYAGGESPYTEFVGNISDLRLPERQLQEINLLSRATPPLVLLLIQGRPRLISDVFKSCNTIIHAGLPGFEGAPAIAEILNGSVNPCGKLPFSYPLNPNHYLPYHYKRSAVYFFNPEQANQIHQGDNTTSLFPFGSGMSYTKFSYSDLRLESSRLSAKKPLAARVTITNTGKRDGSESVLWFTSTRYGKITRPVKQLRHFEKISLKKGESATLKITLTRDMLTYPDENGRPVYEASPCKLMVGGLEEEFYLEAN